MRVLFDHGTPRAIARSLQKHEVKEAKSQGWDTLSNGDLLNAAEAAGFDVLLTNDKNLPFQQNLKGRRLAIVVPSNNKWPNVSRRLEAIAAAIDAATRGSYTVVDIPLH